MKPFFYTLAAIALVVFVLSSAQLISNWSDGFYRLTDTGSLTGWEDTGEANALYQELSKRFSALVLTLKEKANQLKKYSLVLSFAITALAGFSTLLSSIYASKSQEPTPSHVLKLVAILTFITTLVNWGNTQLNEQKSNAEQNLQKTRDLRQEFEVRYEKAEPSERNNLITEYERKLEPLEDN